VSLTSKKTGEKCGDIFACIRSNDTSTRNERRSEASRRQRIPNIYVGDMVQLVSSISPTRVVPGSNLRTGRGDNFIGGGSGWRREGGGERGWEGGTEAGGAREQRPTQALKICDFRTSHRKFSAPVSRIFCKKNMVSRISSDRVSKNILYRVVCCIACKSNSQSEMLDGHGHALFFTSDTGTCSTDGGLLVFESGYVD
jgi:hypothetical protein